MKVLFCSDALVVDGVTSFILHLSTALKEGGIDVAVMGRWAGKGVQSRLRESGVKVFQCLSPTTGNFWFDRKAVGFAPDVIVTDSRRSFPLASRIKEITGAKIFTFFLDKVEKTDRKGRDIPSLIRYSDVWLSMEKPLLEELQKIPTPFGKFHFPRPLKGFIVPSPLPAINPFRVLCYGRLGKFKSVTAFSLLEAAGELKRQIPTLEVAFVGGGWRRFLCGRMAAKLNKEAGAPFIKVAGNQIDPQPWFEWATLVLTGSTSAIEAALAHRPVVASAGHWLGLLTTAKVDEAFSTYFAERAGTNLVRENPGVVSQEILDVYEQWNQSELEKSTLSLRSLVETRFERKGAAEEFERIYEKIAEQGVKIEL